MSEVTQDQALPNPNEVKEVKDKPEVEHKGG